MELDNKVARNFDPETSECCALVGRSCGHRRPSCITRLSCVFADWRVPLLGGSNRSGQTGYMSPRRSGVWLVKVDENVHVCREVCRLDDERPPGNRQTSLHELHALVKARSDRDEFECNVMNAVR